MVEADLRQVLEIEQAAFTTPWREGHFLHELRNNPWAVNRVVEHEGLVVAYACLWCIHDELKINNIAVREDMRGRGVGRWLLLCVLHEGLRRGCATATLEVRPTNRVALHLYRSHGFEEVGRRPDYYGPGEEAILMTLELDRRRWRVISASKPGRV
jgi:ribosomal-protein-alanine N-acetyltransferase